MGRGGFAWGPDSEQQARVAFMDGQHGLASGTEQHQIGFPMAWGPAVARGDWPFLHRAPEVDEGGGTATPTPPPAPSPLGPGQIVAPGPIPA